MEQTNEIPKWQKHRLKNLEAYRKRKKDYAKTPEQRKKRTEYMQKYRAKHKKVRQYKKAGDPRDYHYMSRYGITFAEKQEIIEKQNNKCLICSEEFKNNRHIHVDHCHVTNKLRGILCYSCNSKLGWFEKNKNSVINYLENLRGKKS